MPPMLECDNDLAELAIVLEITMDLHHLVEREGTVDDRLQVTALEALKHELNRGLAAAGVMCAEKVMGSIVETYFAPNRTVADLREIVKTGDSARRRGRSCTRSRRFKRLSPQPAASQAGRAAQASGFPPPGAALSDAKTSSASSTT